MSVTAIFRQPSPPTTGSGSVSGFGPSGDSTSAPHHKINSTQREPFARAFSRYLDSKYVSGS
jgi:hypothetical protein